MAVLLLGSCAACDSSRLDDELAVSTAAVPHIVATTTTVAPPPKAERPPERASRAAPTRTAVRVGVPAPSPGNTTATDYQLLRLAGCESAGDLSAQPRVNPRAYNASGPFYGAFQFMLSTWRSLGGTGDPRDHSYGDQAAIARKIPIPAWLRNQFPHCARQLRRLGVI